MKIWGIMMSTTKAFRKVSIDKLSSPEQLDQSVSIVSPMGWFSLLVTSILIISAIVWGFTGSISKKVETKGVIMYGGDINKIIAPSTGSITDLSVAPGDVVKKGQVIARISQDELMNSIQLCKENIAALESLDVETMQFKTEELTSDIFAQFFQISQQIDLSNQQQSGQIMNYTSNIQQNQQQIQTQKQKVADLQAQHNLAMDSYYNYRDLLARQKDYELESADFNQNSNQPIKDPIEGIVYMDDNGNHYTRTYDSSMQLAVKDQLGSTYIIFSNDGNHSDLPKLYIDAISGSEVYNPDGDYCLPSYYRSVSPHGGASDPLTPESSTPETDTDSTEKSSLVSGNDVIEKSYTSTGGEYIEISNPSLEKIYLDMNANRYIDRSNREFDSYRYTYHDSYDNEDLLDEARDLALAKFKNDPTLLSLNSQGENIRLQLEQSKQQLIFYEQFRTDYLLAPQKQTEVQIANLKEQFEKSKEISMQDINKQLQNLQLQLDLKSKIIAEDDGKILEINYAVGDIVQLGYPVGLFTEEDVKNSQEVLMYIPITDGKKVKEGMEVHISPSTVNQEEYGYIIGIVKSVSEFTVSPEHMVGVLGSSQMTQLLAGNAPSIELTVELIRSTETESGFKWSTSKGAPTIIEAGTFCTGEIKVESNRPIDMVVPFIKKLLFGDDSDVEQK